MDQRQSYLALLFCLILCIQVKGMFIEQPNEIQRNPEDSFYNSIKSYIFPKAPGQNPERMEYADLKGENDSEETEDTDKSSRPVSKVVGPLKRAFCNGYIGCRGWGRRWKRPIVIPVSVKNRQGKRAFCKWGNCSNEKRSFEQVPLKTDRNLEELFTYKRLFCNSYGGCPFPQKREQQFISE